MIDAKIDISSMTRSMVKSSDLIEDYLFDALKECGDIIVDECKLEFRKHFKSHTNKAVNSITVLDITEDNVVVGLDGSAEYAEYLHDGSSSHEVSPVYKKALSWGGNSYSKGHTVGGINGHPFMDIGIKNSENKCVNLIDKALNNAIKDAGI